MKLQIIAIAFIYLQYVNGQGFVSNNIGNIQFTQQLWEFQQILNISDYIYTTKLLEECIDTLTLSCQDRESELCTYFIKTTRDVNLNINTDIANLNTLLREKREITLLTVGLIALGTSIVTFIASYFMYKSALEDVKKEFIQKLFHPNFESKNICFYCQSNQNCQTVWYNR